MSGPLSPYRLNKARELYNLFNILNSFSYALLAGNIITIYAMRLNASSTVIGMLSALVYWAYFFTPLGKGLVKRFPIVKVFAFAWLVRVICMIPLIFAPFAAAAGRNGTALLLMTVSVFGFHFWRGVGTIGNNPLLNALASGPDRGGYITLIQVINNGVSMSSSFALALVLGRNPPLILYSVIMTIGIVTGIFGAYLLSKLPEPEAADEKETVGFFGAAKEALAQSSFKRFLLIFLAVNFASALARAFVVVYSREVFFQGDGMVSLYTVFGGLGAFTMGLITKFLVDRIGAKPLYVTCTIAGLVSLLPALFLFPAMMESPAQVMLFLTSVHFLISFAFLGAEGLAQTYFFGLIPAKQMLNMGILYYLVFGISGGGGAFLGGLFLDLLSRLGFTVFLSYKILFGLLVLMLCWVLYMQRKMVSLGALSLRGALEVMFSFRDLRAITILDKLEKTCDAQEEEELLEALHSAPSHLAKKGLLDRTKSPRLAVRTESLRALGSLQTLSEKEGRILEDDIANNPYTTAYISARILGGHGFFSAIPLLRAKLKSGDYMLAGECMIALAHLNDADSIPEIEKIIHKSKNPRLKIMGVTALGIFAATESLPALLELLRAEDPPPYLRDEVVLALAGILDIENQFYPVLVRYLEHPELGPALAQDEAEAACEFYAAARQKQGAKKQREGMSLQAARSLQAAAGAFMKDAKGAHLSRWILQLKLDGDPAFIQMVLSEAALDNDLVPHERLRLLICQWASYQLRVLARAL
ncbi:MAG: MFS transporter [Spirochaetaceae bacterium]|nr:MFS transporter [Spirochaetaceae bacterium]